MQSTQENCKKLFLDLVAFDETQSYKELLLEACQPVDLTQDGVLTAERVELFSEKTNALSYIYAFERVTDKTIDCLIALSRELRVIEKMKAMQNGDVVNFIGGFESERRAVLHTATRDLFGKRSLLPTAKSASEESIKEHEKLKKFLDGSAKHFSDMIFIGIGGSELGPRALYQSLSFLQDSEKSVHFIGNVDPDDVEATLQAVSLEKTVVVVISKSGTTLETETNEAYVRRAFDEKGLDSKKHFISVTMPDTPMDNKERYLETFYLWDYVGGRYSATSMVGGILLGFMIGYEHFLELCRGASDMDETALIEDERKNVPLLAALIGIWNRNFLHYPTVGVIPYSRQLARFPAHLQQCDMESNGKRIDRRGELAHFPTGPIVWGEPGTNAQHSFFQLLHQGTNIVPLEMIGFQECQSGNDFEYKQTTSQEKLLSNLFAQAIALAKGEKSDNPNKQFPGNRPSSLILAKKLTPYVLGQLLAFYEHKIAFQGFIWGINSFDQEGVQLGKVLAKRVLNLYAARRQGIESESFKLGQALVSIVDEVQ